jgi:hypothetical protein
MSSRQQRRFKGGPAVRVAQPLWLAIVGASGSGKTLSGILLAEGIKRVQAGPIVVIDTENFRALKHSNGNPDRFIHVPFEPPFGPLDYIDAITAAMTYSPSTIIIDSMSHEHEGDGGVLDQHDTVVAEKGRSHDQIAWKKPKGERTKLKHFLLQQRCNFIFCYRAKKKIKPVKGGEPEDLGWQPLGDDNMIFEMDMCALLYPGVDGRPKWTSKLHHEQEMMKVPGWWRALFASEPQLNPDIGEQLARWAAGADVGGPSSTATSSRRTSAAPTLTERFDACTSDDAWVELDAEAEEQWAKATPAQREKNVAGRARMVEARERARARLAAEGYER